MDILNLGESIKNGNYKLHSKYKCVHNYIKNKEIVSLVSVEIGRGPNNVVLHKFPKLAEGLLVISNGNLSLGTTILHFDRVKTGTEKKIFIADISCLLSVLKVLTGSIRDKIPPKSLGFLLFPQNEAFFETPFEKTLLNHVKQAVQILNFKKLPGIAKKMKGVGFGLTPSGDDFNCGLLYALNYLEKILGFDLSEIIAECYSNSIGNNLISNTFLKYACSNHYYEHFFELLRALKQNNRKNIAYYTDKLIKSGHTSGIDMLTGFMLTLKGVLNDQKSS